MNRCFLIIEYEGKEKTRLNDAVGQARPTEHRSGGDLLSIILPSPKKDFFALIDEIIFGSKEHLIHFDS